MQPPLALTPFTNTSPTHERIRRTRVTHVTPLQDQHEDPTILFVGEPELVELKLVEDAPLVVVQFACQQIKCTRDKFGNVVDGNPNSIQVRGGARACARVDVCVYACVWSGVSARSMFDHAAALAARVHACMYVWASGGGGGGDGEG